MSEWSVDDHPFKVTWFFVGWRTSRTKLFKTEKEARLAVSRHFKKFEQRARVDECVSARGHYMEIIRRERLQNGYTYTRGGDRFPTR